MGFYSGFDGFILTKRRGKLIFQLVETPPTNITLKYITHQMPIKKVFKTIYYEIRLGRWNC